MSKLTLEIEASREGNQVPTTPRGLLLSSGGLRSPSKVAPQLVNLMRGAEIPNLICNESLADMFESAVRAFPEQVAIDFEGESITFSQLNARAEALASKLLATYDLVPGKIACMWISRGVPLFVAMLAITKCGAAWLPMDRDVAPLSRVLECAIDADAACLVTDFDEPMPLPSTTLPVCQVRDFPLSSSAVVRRCRFQVTSTDPAYLIYTSGSTGKPKGIVISQGAITHYLRASNYVYGIKSTDRVFQGFSLAFDASFEEVWIPLMVGATMVGAPRAVTTDPEQLVKVLQRVSVWCTVPTLLALFPVDVPNLRIVILGGEACPDAVLEKWCKPYRQLFNTYGPTEATVACTYSRLELGTRVSIGRPYPNYSICVLDPEANVVLSQPGGVGELGVAGPGLALQYWRRPELTDAKFVNVPGLGRVYRTGDLGRLHEDNFHCLGRIDDQVKIRGFRVELGEIEAALQDLADISAAVVLLHQSPDVGDVLVAYCVGVRRSLQDLRRSLAARLPPYMIPDRVQWLDSVPRLMSGKIDRKALRALPWAASAQDENEDVSDVPCTPAQELLFQSLRKILPGRALRLADDFFTDLGGHSLTAAQLVSMIRQAPGYSDASIHTIYVSRTLEQIAASLDTLQAMHSSEQHSLSGSGGSSLTDRLESTPWRRWVCGLAQAVFIPWLILMQVGLWLFPFLTFQVVKVDFGVGPAIGVALAEYIGLILLYFILYIVSCRLLLSTIRPGHYKPWGWEFFRWWLCRRLCDVTPFFMIHGTPLFSMALRLAGAHIGADVHLAGTEIDLPHLLYVGDGASMGGHGFLSNAVVESGRFIVGLIRIEKEASLGTYVVLYPDTVVGSGALLRSQSSLNFGATVPAMQTWAGSPAARTKEVVSVQPRPVTSWWRLAVFEPLFFALATVIAELIFYLPIFPTFIIVEYVSATFFIDDNTNNWIVSLVYFTLALPASAILTIFVLILLALTKAMIKPMKPGTYSLHEATYYRKWWTSALQARAFHYCYAIFESIFTAHIYRLLGATVGRNVELASMEGVVFELLEIGEGSFMASDGILGDDDVRGGWVTLKRTVLGKRVFLGNSSYTPGGTEFPDNFLLGVQSHAPDNALMASGQTWVGSPPMMLPNRDKTDSNDKYPPHLTFAPTTGRKLIRGSLELLRLLIPLQLVIGSAYNMLYYGAELLSYPNAAVIVFGLLGMAFAFGLLCYVFTLAIKWLLLGRMHKRSMPMWTLYVCLSEFTETLYINVACFYFLNKFIATPFLPTLLWFYGIDIGHDTFLNTTDFPDFDLIHVGDGAEINHGALLQPHVFEDRVLKYDDAYLGKGASLGVRSIALLNSKTGDDCVIGPLSLVMKGETVSSGTKWHGCPLKPLGRGGVPRLASSWKSSSTKAQPENLVAATKAVDSNDKLLLV